MHFPSFVLKLISFFLSAILCATLVSCTAGSKNSVSARFPKSLKIDAFLFFNTDREANCTFAEVSILASSFIDQEKIVQSHSNIEALRIANDIDVRAEYQFLEDGFGYFVGLDLTELSAVMDASGDPTLSEGLSAAIFIAKKCLRSLSIEKKIKKYDDYYERIFSNGGIIIVGVDKPRTVIIYFPENQTALYLAP